jgi:hypothetical protein
MIIISRFGMQDFRLERSISRVAKVELQQCPRSERLVVG